MPFIKNEKRILWLFSSLSFLVGLDALVVSPLIPSMASDLEFPAASGGLLVTAYALLYGLSAPLFGPLSDYWGRKRMITCGMLLFAAGTALLAVGQNLPQLLLFRAIAGIGGAMVMPSVYALLADIIPADRRGRAIARVTGAMGAATMIGIPAGSFMAEYGSWKYTFLLLGGAALAAAWILHRQLRTDDASHRENTAGTHSFVLTRLREIVSNGAIGLALLCTFLWWAAFQGLFANMGIFYSSSFPISAGIIGLIFSLAGFGNWMGNKLGGRAADRYGSRAVMYTACILCSVWMISIPFASNWLSFVIVLHFLWSVSTGIGQVSLATYISQLLPSSRGTLLAFNSAATYLGMTCSTAVASGILEQGSFKAVGIVCGISAALVPFIMLSLRIMQQNKPMRKAVES
jgi:multidrug resistance protein